MNFLLNRLREPIQPTHHHLDVSTASTPQDGTPSIKKGPNGGTNRRLGLDMPVYECHVITMATSTTNGARDRSRAPTGKFFSFFICFFILLLTIVSHRYIMKPIGINNRVKKAQTTRLASFGPLVSFFLLYSLFILVTNLFLHI